MTNPESDDQIIATAFRRSLQVFGLIAVLVGLVFVARWWQTEPAEQVQSAQPIAPQSLSSVKQVEPPKVVFTDISGATGIDYVHFSGAYGERLLPETMGGGVAVFDFNNDSFVDVLFVNGGVWPWRDDKSSLRQSGLRLYRGSEEGRFTDVTEASGLDTELYGMGVAVGDYDADGYIDVFITAVGANRLFRNVNGEQFVDQTESAGVAGDESAWSTGAGFLDHDRDGDLDLMVLNYVRWSREIDLQANYQLTGIGRAYGPPSQFAGTHSYFYENLGDGRFDESSEEVGIQVNNSATGNAVGKGLALLPMDINADGWVDLLIANDTVRNFLFLNDQKGGFEEVGIEKGMAFDNTGSATGAMGIDGAVFDETAEQAIAIGNFGNEMTSLYVSAQDEGLFTDQAVVTGVGPLSRRAVTFGLLFLDYDLDGRLDLIQANGHIEPEINVVEPSQLYAQPPQLFWNCGYSCPRQFIPVELAKQNDLSKPIVGRGLAATDLDRDGDLDLILTQIDGPAKILRNDQSLGHNWIQFDLRLANGAPAYGTQLTLQAKDTVQSATVNPTRSYLTQVDPVLVFGLGKLDSTPSAIVTWPDGSQQTLNLPLNQRHTITQGE